MTFPAFLFGCLIASIFCCAYHFWRGGKAGKLLLYNVFAWVGFWVGYLIGDLMGWRFLTVGPLNLGISILFTLLFILVGSWLSQIQTESK